jgi:hypothetical protein
MILGHVQFRPPQNLQRNQTRWPVYYLVAETLGRMNYQFSLIKYSLCICKGRKKEVTEWRVEQKIMLIWNLCVHETMTVVHQHAFLSLTCCHGGFSCRHTWMVETNAENKFVKATWKLCISSSLSWGKNVTAAPGWLPAPPLLLGWRWIAPQNVETHERLLVDKCKGAWESQRQDHSEAMLCFSFTCKAARQPFPRDVKNHHRCYWSLIASVLIWQTAYRAC